MRKQSRSFASALALAFASVSSACLEPNTYAYALVEVDAVTKHLNVTLKNADEDAAI